MAPYTIWNTSTACKCHGKGKTFYDKKALEAQLKSLSRKQNKLRHVESQNTIRVYQCSGSDLHCDTIKYSIRRAFLMLIVQ